MGQHWDIHNAPIGTKVYSSRGNEIRNVRRVTFAGNPDEKRGVAVVEILLKDDGGEFIPVADAKSVAFAYPKIWCEVVFPGDKPLSSFPVSAWQRKVLTELVDWVDDNPVVMVSPVIIEES